jgi:hypothetical protein
MKLSVEEFLKSSLYKAVEQEALKDIVKYPMLFAEVLPLMFKYTSVSNIMELCTESRKFFENTHRDVVDSISLNGII